MVRVIKRKTYRKINNEGMRSNVSVKILADFEDIKMYDVISIVTSVMTDDPQMLSRIVKHGFLPVRKYRGSVYCTSISFTKLDTMKEIIKDFKL